MWSYKHMKVAVHQTLVSYHAPMTPKNAVYLGNSLKYDDQEVLESLTLFRESVISNSLLQKTLQNDYLLRFHLINIYV